MCMGCGHCRGGATVWGGATGGVGRGVGPLYGVWPLEGWGHCRLCYSHLPLSLQENEDGIHDNLALHHCDELTRSAQTVLQLLHFGACKEVLQMVRANVM